MAATAGDLSGLRTPGRIRALVEARLRAVAPHKEALRQAVALMALPWNAGLAIRTGARTSNAIWQAAGDRSDDVSWYTRRASLAAIYAATLAFWLRDESEETGPALAFLDRRMGGLARLGRCRKRWFSARAA
jgi:ubiquinone biosynthesis protein COQ9